MAGLDILNFELCLIDQSSPLFGCSIMSFSILCVSSRVSATTTKAQSSTKPAAISFLPWVISISSTL